MTQTPTASTFRDPLIRVLGTMTGLKTGEVVTSSEVIEAVCKETGIDVNGWGEDTLGRPQVKTWILQAFNRKVKADGLADNVGRGKWVLTDEGVKVASVLLGQPIPEPVTSDEDADDAPSLDDLLDLLDADESEAPDEDADEPEAPNLPEPQHEGGAGLAWDIGEMTNTYMEDAYLRTLAMQATDCMGKWSARSDVCGSCPLSGACKAQAMASLAEIAMIMDRDDENKARVAAGIDPTITPPKDDMKDTVDTVLDIINEDDLKDSTPKLTFKSAEMNTMVGTVCSHCKTDIEAGELSVWIREASDPSYNGMYHPKCWEAKQKE